MQRPWRMLLTGLLFMVCSACFFVATRWATPPTVNWVLRYPSSVKEMLRRLPTGQSGRSIFSPEVLYPNESSLCEVDMKNSQHSSFVSLNRGFSNLEIVTVSIIVAYD